MSTETKEDRKVRVEAELWREIKNTKNVSEAETHLHIMRDRNTSLDNIQSELMQDLTAYSKTIMIISAFSPSIPERDRLITIYVVAMYNLIQRARCHHGLI